MEEYKYTIIDNETGDFKKAENVAIMNEGDIIIRKSQSEGYKQHIENVKGRKEFANDYGNFLFRFHGDDYIPTYNNLSDSDMARLIYVATFADYEGVLRLDTGAIMGKTTLYKIVGVHRNIFNKWYDLMVDNSLLIISDDCILVNKYYCTKGVIADKNVEYTRVFINSIRNLYESNTGKNMSTIGSVFKLIPYMQFRFCVLCSNPKSNGKTQMLRMKDVATILGFDETQIKRCISTLTKYRINNEPVFKFVTDSINRADDNVLINPKLFYSGHMKDYPLALNFFDTGDLKLLDSKKSYLTQSAHLLDTK